MRYSFLLSIVLFTTVVSNAQKLGEPGMQKLIGNTSLANGNRIGKSSLPVCLPGGNACTNIPYTFIGNGNWDIKTNWLGEIIPPAVLPSGQMILISPVEGGECVLNVEQTIAAGAAVSVIATGRLRIQKLLLYLK